MTVLFVFALTLLVAVLVSELADRSVLSTAVLFLVAGFLAGDGMFGVIESRPDNPVVASFAELALFSILFSDGMKVGVRELATAWRLPGRALLFGLPLTLLGTALLGRLVVGLSWAEALLVGAVLSPTDPVFAAAIVGREEVPARLRHLLNVESGLNDGLALPIVVAMLAVVGGGDAHLLGILGEVGLGVALGVAIPLAAIKLGQLRFFAAQHAYRPLNGFAIGLLVLASARLAHGNEFLAAFAAGITVASAGPEVRESFHGFGELVAELLKLAALLIFGALITPRFLGEIAGPGYLFMVLTLIAVRPAALLVSYIGSRLAWREWAAAAWFGPKGFASVVFGLLIYNEGVGGSIARDRADGMFHLIALCVVGSIVAHSSTDVVVARWLGSREIEPPGSPVPVPVPVPEEIDRPDEPPPPRD